ncbi:MAG: hypothetical protein PF638_00060 [Candidatus Delongbacteria bacterium]|jgi:hypothetical protein|nr:hypothetical protein [Candidatus Delongbacteria bacterium]
MNWNKENILSLFLTLLLIIINIFEFFDKNIIGLISAIIIFYLVKYLGQSSVFDIFGLEKLKSIDEIFESNKKMASFIIRKSLWIFIPLFYMFLVSDTNLLSLGLSFNLCASIQLILFIILILTTILIYVGTRWRAKNFKTFRKSFLVAFFAAGLPEDLLVIGLIGGKMHTLLIFYIPSIWSTVLTLVLINSFFCLSHIPSVKKAKKFYSENMTQKNNMSYTRMFIQMFLLGLPGWILYFLSGHIYFSAWWHTLADISAFLPKKEESLDN